MPETSLTRRSFLDTLTAAPVAAALGTSLGTALQPMDAGAAQAASGAPGTSAPRDLPRATTPANADLGSNAGLVEALGGQPH